MDDTDSTSQSDGSSNKKKKPETGPAEILTADLQSISQAESINNSII